MKNIEELKSWFEGDKFYEGEYVNHKIDQLDEPEVLSSDWIDEHKVDYDHWMPVVPIVHLQNLLVPKQELPVIPQFIADYLPLVKEDIELEKASYYAVTDNELPKWKREYDWIRENFETFVKAWLAYPDIEVEEEQKYYVLNNEKYFLLGKDKGHGFIFSTGGNSKLGSMERTSATFELTEQEIKGYDSRYMTFAVPVEELEEC